MSFYLINKVFFFQDRVFLYSSGWSRTQHPPAYQDYRQAQATGPACVMLYEDLSIFWFWCLREEGLCYNPQVVTNSSHPWDSMLGCWTVKRLQRESSEGSSHLLPSHSTSPSSPRKQGVGRDAWCKPITSFCLDWVVPVTKELWELISDLRICLTPTHQPPTPL